MGKDIYEPRIVPKFNFELKNSDKKKWGRDYSRNPTIYLKGLNLCADECSFYLLRYKISHIIIIDFLILG